MQKQDQKQKVEHKKEKPLKINGSLDGVLKASVSKKKKDEGKKATN